MQLTKLFEKRMQIAPAKNQPKATTPKKKTTTMAPSSTRLPALSLGALEGDASSSGARPVPTPHPEESLLYLMPSDLHPTYRPLPVLVQSVVVFLSMFVSAVSTWEHLTFLQPLAILRGWRSVPSFGECLAFAAKVRDLGVARRAFMFYLYCSAVLIFNVFL
jgi:hypothetical protein